MSVTAADIAGGVTPREYRRLLGWPRGATIPEELLQIERRARAWYGRHATPFAMTRRVAIDVLGETTVAVNSGIVLKGAALARRLADGGAHALLVCAVSAGSEAALEATHLWQSGRPEAAYSLERFAAAAAERLVRHVASEVCASLRPRRERLLPHLSPGCGGWDLAEQHRLMELLGGRPAIDAAEGGSARLGPLTMLPSGAMHPQHSLLAVFGIADRQARVRPAAACQSCDLDPCQFRRVPSARPDVLRVPS
ncbi:MAG TPA: hypothetical protein VMT50_07605 [Steroidobacteraceae bacterium]|nr:hypothetical protein [Steroidobacteraceae bacterium]